MIRLLALIACLLATPAYAAAAQAVVAPEDAGSHVGQTVTVEGVVDQVHRSHGNIFLDMGGIYPNNAFTGYVAPAYAKSFKDIDKLDGATVDITGEISLYHKRPEIKLTSPSQLKPK